MLTGHMFPPLQPALMKFLVFGDFADICIVKINRLPYDYVSTTTTRSSRIADNSDKKHRPGYVDYRVAPS